MYAWNISQCLFSTYLDKYQTDALSRSNAAYGTVKLSVTSIPIAIETIEATTYPGNLPSVNFVLIFQ